MLPGRKVHRGYVMVAIPSKLRFIFLVFGVGFLFSIHSAQACRVLPDPGFQNIPAGGVATITAWTRNCPADLVIWVASSFPSSPTAPVPPLPYGWTVLNNPQIGSTATFEIRTPYFATKGQHQLFLFGQSQSNPYSAGAAIFIVNIQ